MRRFFTPASEMKVHYKASRPSGLRLVTPILYLIGPSISWIEILFCLTQEWFFATVLTYEVCFKVIQIGGSGIFGGFQK